MNYYVCVYVGLCVLMVINYCDFIDQWIDLEKYEKKYVLVFICLKVIGSVFFVVMLFFFGLFLILYGEIVNYLRKIELFCGGLKNVYFF